MESGQLKLERSVNGVVVEQQVTDGFINATAMAVAHGKDLSQWLRTKDAYDTFEALACMSGLNPVDLQDSDRVGLSAKKMADYFPRFIVSKRGAPENGGGTWLHPDIALQCAQWCNKTFAIQVSRWVREWLTTGHAPIQPVDVVQELAAWQQRYDLRVYLKDVLRPDLMDATKAWAQAHGMSAITLCSTVHDDMNKGIQGLEAEEIHVRNGIAANDLLRDYYGPRPLMDYSFISQVACNLILDKGFEPRAAAAEACSVYFPKSRTLSPVPIEENLYSQGARLKRSYRKKRLQQGIQLNMFEQRLDQAS